jgi:predicted GIY-YIG superfamily endonuclease
MDGYYTDRDMAVGQAAFFVLAHGATFARELRVNNSWAVLYLATGPYAGWHETGWANDPHFGELVAEARKMRSGKPKSRASRSTPHGTHVVYRHFTAEDILLYVGYSSDCDARQRQHANSSDWWPESARMTVERFSDRSTALRAELAAIRAEHPLWNIQHNPR